MSDVKRFFLSFLMSIVIIVLAMFFCMYVYVPPFSGSLMLALGGLSALFFYWLLGKGQR